MLAVGCVSKEDLGFTGTGVVDIFQRPARNLPYVAFQTVHSPMTPTANSLNFGYTVLLSDDARTLVVTHLNGFNPAEVSVFTRPDSASQFQVSQRLDLVMPDGTTPGERAYAADMTPNGSAFVVGSAHKGAHWTFVRNSTTGFYALAHSVARANMNYGFAVAINYEHLVLVTAPSQHQPCGNQGMTYSYARSNETHWFVQQEIQVDTSPCISGKNWGNTLAAAQDFRTIMIGNHISAEDGTSNGVAQILMRP